jgi:hypothetical protein
MSLHPVRHRPCANRSGRPPPARIRAARHTLPQPACGVEAVGVGKHHPESGCREPARLPSHQAPCFNSPLPLFSLGVGCSWKQPGRQLLPPSPARRLASGWIASTASRARDATSWCRCGSTSATAVGSGGLCGQADHCRDGLNMALGSLLAAAGRQRSIGGMGSSISRAASAGWSCAAAARGSCDRGRTACIRHSETLDPMAARVGQHRRVH